MVRRGRRLALVRDPICVVTRGSSYENRANLAPAFFDQIIRKYEGTRLGRQERALLLKHQKAPGELDHAAADPGVAGSGEPLFAAARAALISSGEPVKPA